MSQENVEVIQRLCEAFNRRDFLRAAQYLHPVGEVYPGAGGGTGNRLYGREELLRFFQDLGDTWETVTAELREVIDAPDGRVLAFEYWHIQGATASRWTPGSSTSMHFKTASSAGWTASLTEPRPSKP